MTGTIDVDRQARGVKLMLALLGAFLLGYGWVQWMTLAGFLR